MSVNNRQLEVRKSLRHSNSDSKLKYNHEYTNDYTLNIEKSLKKKLESTKRTEITYELTNGGITAKLDAVTFELFIYACEQYYSIQTSNCEYSKSVATDKAGNTVQYTYHISRKQPESSNFTINAYLTKCSLLINGRNCEIFCDKDLDNIHNIMINTKIDGAKINTKLLNKTLENKLQSALNEMKKPVDTKSIDVDREDHTNEKCYKCKRTSITKSVQCTNGHWVHYMCERLSREEIDKLENKELKFNYTCKICLGIDVKLPNHTIPVVEITRTIRKEIESNSNTSAKTLLIEENECNSCDITDNCDNQCINCGLPFHTTCLQTTTQKCFNCIGLEDQNTSDSVLHTTKHKTVTCTELNDNEQEVIQIANNSSQNNQIHSNKDEASIQKEQQNEKQKHVHNQQQDSEIQINTRLKELKQLEQKLKKREEQIKIKEAMVNEDLREKIQIMDRLHQSEIRNIELENTIKTLYTQIENLKQRTNVTNSDTNNRSPITNREDEIIIGLRNRVTKFVLNRLDKEFDQMEKSLDNTTTVEANYTYEQNCAQKTQPINNTTTVEANSLCEPNYTREPQQYTNLDQFSDRRTQQQSSSRLNKNQSNERIKSVGTDHNSKNYVNKTGLYNNSTIEGQPLYYNQNPQQQPFLYYPSLHNGRYK